MTMPRLLTCQETTRLVLEGEDRALPLGERVLVRVHLSMCKGCTRFSKQVRLMREALDDWRQQGGQGGQADQAPSVPPPDKS